MISKIYETYLLVTIASAPTCIILKDHPDDRLDAIGRVLWRNLLLAFSTEWIVVIVSIIIKIWN